MYNMNLETILTWMNINIIYFAIMNAIIWFIITIRWKKLRQNGLSSLWSYWLVASWLPLWIITFLLLNNGFEVNYSSQYIFIVLFWVIAVIISNILDLYLIKFRPLSELKIYKIWLSALLGMIVDILFFQTIFSYFTAISIILFFISWALLTKKEKSKQEKRKRLLKDLLIITFLWWLWIFQATTYKLALPLQELSIIHAMIAQIFAHSIWLILAFKHMKNAYIKKIIHIKDFFVFWILIYLFTIFEAFIYTALPISIITLLAVLKLLLFTVYDIKTKEIKPSIAIYIAIVLAIIALSLINI